MPPVPRPVSGLAWALACPVRLACRVVTPINASGGERQTVPHEEWPSRWSRSRGALCARPTGALTASRLERARGLPAGARTVRPSLPGWRNSQQHARRQSRLIVGGSDARPTWRLIRLPLGALSLSSTVNDEFVARAGPLQPPPAGASPRAAPMAIAIGAQCVEQQARTAGWRRGSGSGPAGR